MCCVLCQHPNTLFTEHTQHMNNSYPHKFSTNYCMRILFFNIYCETIIWKLIFYSLTFVWWFLINPTLKMVTKGNRNIWKV